MALSNAEKQRAYRDRLKAKEEAVVSLFYTPDELELIAEMSDHIAKAQQIAAYLNASLLDRLKAQPLTLEIARLIEERQGKTVRHSFAVV